jgi:hypothetical protein
LKYSCILLVPLRPFPEGVRLTLRYFQNDAWQEAASDEWEALLKEAEAALVHTPLFCGVASGGGQSRAMPLCCCKERWCLHFVVKRSIIFLDGKKRARLNGKK